MAVSVVGEMLEPGVFVGAGVGVLDELGRGDGLLEGVGFAAGFLIATPLFQTNLLPCLMQVYLILETTLVAPALVHLVDEIETALAGIKNI